MASDYLDNERETCCHHFMDYSFQLVARDLLYAPSYKQDSTYHDICYTICGALAGTRNSSVVPPGGIDPMTHCIKSGCSATELHPTAAIIIKWFSFLMALSSRSNEYNN